MTEYPDLLPTPVQNWISAFNAGDVAAIVALYAEDAELFDSGMPRPRHGRDEITEWFRLRFQSMPENVYTPISHEELDDGRIVVGWNMAGRGPRLLGQGWLAREFRIAGKSEFFLREGLIYRQQGSYEHLEVLWQLLPPLRWLPAGIARSLYSLYFRRHFRS